MSDDIVMAVVVQLGNKGGGGEADERRVQEHDSRPSVETEETRRIRGEKTEILWSLELLMHRQFAMKLCRGCASWRSLKMQKRGNRPKERRGEERNRKEK